MKPLGLEATGLDQPGDGLMEAPGITPTGHLTTQAIMREFKTKHHLTGRE